MKKYGDIIFFRQTIQLNTEFQESVYMMFVVSTTDAIPLHLRACLKKAFRELRVPVCGRFYPNEGGVAGYGNRMRVKYTAKWGLQIAEMIFQTCSRALLPAGRG